MEGSKTLFSYSKFPWARDGVSPKFIDKLGTRPQKCSTALLQGNRRTTDKTCLFSPLAMPFSQFFF